MNRFDDHVERLRDAYPEASYSALHHLPKGFEADAAKAGAFFRTWAQAEDLAGMLEARVGALAKRFPEPFPGVLGVSFEDLRHMHRSAFLRQVQKAAAQDGLVSQELLYGAFGGELDKIRELESNIKLLHGLSGAKALSLCRRSRKC